MGRKKKAEEGVEVVAALPQPANVEQIKFEGVPCKYLKLKSTPVPTYAKQEPVWELKLESREAKYKVDGILYGESSAWFTAGGHVTLVPLSNVAYALPT